MTKNTRAFLCLGDEGMWLEWKDEDMDLTEDDFEKEEEEPGFDPGCELDTACWFEVNDVAYDPDTQECDLGVSRLFEFSHCPKCGRDLAG